MGDQKLGLAIIGYGGMGEWHAHTLAGIPHMELRGIYDIDQSRNAAAKKAGIPVYAFIGDVLADPEVKAVTVATPNDVHFPIAIAAMNAGKHVICEKPVALNSGQLSEMIACSKKNGVLFTVHQNRRWDEDFLTIKELYEKNTLGSVFNLESRVHGSRGIPGDWRNTKEHGGGMVLDWGVHLIDQVLMLFGNKKLETVYARLSHITNEAVEDGFRAIFHFSGGPDCLLEVGTSNFISLPRWYAQGENGTAVIRDWDLSGEIIMVSDWEKRDAVPVVTAAGLTKTMAPRTEETIQRYSLPKVQSDIRDFYRNVYDAVLHKAELMVKPSEAMRVMRVMEAIFESASFGQSVSFVEEAALELRNQ